MKAIIRILNGKISYFNQLSFNRSNSLVEFRPMNSHKIRPKSSYGTSDEVGRAKSSFGMSSKTITRISRLI